MIRIKHISDTHGSFPALDGNYNIVVHSGDFCPNFGYGPHEIKDQKNWLKSKIPNIKKWLKNKPFYFVLGNHDFIPSIDFEFILKDNNIEAYDLTEKIITYEGLNLYGFPYIPPINGQYNYELDTKQMVKKVDAMVAVANQTYVDVIVAHCPPYNCLDYCYHQYKNFGNTVLTDALNYKFSEKMLPSALLVGHIHSSNSITNLNGIIVSNAADTQHIIQL